MLLTVIEQLLELFESLGVEATVVPSFTEDLCRLSPGEYVETILVGAMGAKSIPVGNNHHFDKDREGDASLLNKLGAELDFAVHAAPMVFVDGEEVSQRSKSFILEKRVNGVSRRITIGKCSELSFDAAKKQACIMLGE